MTGGPSIDDGAAAVSPTPDRRNPTGPRVGGPLALFGRVRDFAVRDTNVVILATVFQNLLRMGSTLILTRLLAPDAFGVAGLIGMISYTLIMLSDLGFVPFLVRHANADDPRLLDVVWTLRLLRAIGLTVVTALLSGVIARLLGSPEIQPVIAVSSLLFLIEGLSSLGGIMALRRGQLLRLSVMDLSAGLAQLLFAIGFAIVLRSYWAIVLAMLASNALHSVLSYTMFRGERRRFRYDRAIAAELWRFARFIIGSSALTMALGQADKLLLSNFLSLELFGLYMLAFNLSAAPRNFCDAYAGRVLYPAYARSQLEGGEGVRAAFYTRGRRLLAGLYSFAAGGLIGSAPLVIAVLYDPRYAGAGFYLTMLGFAALFALSSAASTQALIAIGQVRATFHANIVRLGWVAVAGGAAVAMGDARAIVVVIGLGEIPATLYNWWALRRAGVLRLRLEALTLAAGAAGAAIGYAGYRAADAMFTL